MSSGRRGLGRERSGVEAEARLQRRPPRGTPTNLGGLDQMIGFVVRRAQVGMMQEFRRALKGLDLTPAQFSVLRVIASNPGLAQARVAEALMIERARLVQMIDSLEAAGRVERARSVTDRRSHALHLTAAGAELLKRAQGPVEAHERNMAARIGAKDREELLRILAPFLS